MIGLREQSTFASYHPGVSFVYFVLVTAISMSTMNPWFLAGSFVSAFSYTIILSGKGAVKFNIMFIIPLILLSSVFNMLMVHEGVTVLFFMYDNAVTLEALIYGAVIGLMLSGVLMWLLCYQVIMTSDKFIFLFGRILPTIALTISMIFRYIPLIRKRYEEITQGQRCMGRDLKEGSFFSRVRQAAKEVSILIAWSLESSIETSESMEARGYGLPGRTSFHLFVFRRRDLWMITLIIILGACIIAGNISGSTTIYYYPYIRYPKQDVLSFAVYILYYILLLIPVITDIGGELRWRRLRLRV